MTKLIGEKSDGTPPRTVLDDWLRRVGPSVTDPTMPRYWFWNGIKTFNSYEDFIDD